MSSEVRPGRSSDNGLAVFISENLWREAHESYSPELHVDLAHQMSVTICSRAYTAPADARMLLEWQSYLGHEGLSEWLSAVPGLPRFTGCALMAADTLEVGSRSARFRGAFAADYEPNELARERYGIERVDQETMVAMAGTVSAALATGDLRRAMGRAMFALRIASSAVSHLWPDSRALTEQFELCLEKLTDNLDDAEFELREAREALARGDRPWAE